MPDSIIPFSLKDAPALIEKLLPVQKLSAEAYKEQMAGAGKTLTALGSYWKGRKPLILNKACILGCLLPATADSDRDLAIFEKLMAMDSESLAFRLANKKDKVSRELIDLVDTSRYKQLVQAASRPEECDDELFDHVWDDVNAHLGTAARSFPELVEQLGIMRFGHRPRVADTFCGSGQIPFEAARLGCDVYASDLNPIACMLTWGAFNIVGGSEESRNKLALDQKELVGKVQAEIDLLGVETDGNGWRAKVFLYCVEARCPQSGWMVPLIPSLIISKGYRVIAELVPDSINKRYDIVVRSGVTEDEVNIAANGTVRTDGKGKDPYLVHTVDGMEYKTKISTLRGDYKQEDGSNGNRLRMWEKLDFKPRPDDILQERLYCIQWMRKKKNSKSDEYEFRCVTSEDLERERIVEEFIAKNLADWQDKGWVPDMRIEDGDKTDEPIRTRGWTYWHHLFNPRQIFLAASYRKYLTAHNSIAFNKFMDYNAKICMWDSNPGVGRVGKTIHVFYNQALNTLYNYATRGSAWVSDFFDIDYKKFPIQTITKVVPKVVQEFDISNDIFITDPPYGDAVKYEEILEFFIAWLRKNPPPEFADWVWDSRRSLAIKGEDENFRREMVAAYKRMTECMPDNGLQVIMFTHQSGSIWADMANIVWASGLQVTAAWYVVTETDSALREGSHVKGTVLLICRKRLGQHKTTRDDLAWEIQEEVENQVKELTGLNQSVRGLYRDENVFEDADIQMAGYAAALRVLTRYAIIDGRDMTAEAIRPRVKGEITFVDSLIAFAVETANQALVPQGIAKNYWDKLSGAERFYLKMIEMEARGFKTLDNYQNFAKAFKVKDFKVLMSEQKANKSRLRTAEEFARAEMGEGSELYQSVLRAVLYAMMELIKDIDSDEVLAHLMLNVPNYYGDKSQRELVVELADYLAKHLSEIRQADSRAARILCEMIKNQRLG
jgi:putative DNA methylase